MRSLGPKFNLVKYNIIPNDIGVTSTTSNRMTETLSGRHSSPVKLERFGTKRVHILLLLSSYGDVPMTLRYSNLSSLRIVKEEVIYESLTIDNKNLL